MDATPGGPVGLSPQLNVPSTSVQRTKPPLTRRMSDKLVEGPDTWKIAFESIELRSVRRDLRIPHAETGGFDSPAIARDDLPAVGARSLPEARDGFLAAAHPRARRRAERLVPDERGPRHAGPAAGLHHRQRPGTPRSPPPP